MSEKVIISQAGFHRAGLDSPRVVEITKPRHGRSIVVELVDDQNTTLDLSAVADQNLTLAQAGTKLVIQFDNDSAVIADPFFDFSGKPFAHIGVELSAGRAMTGEQFTQLFPITMAQSVLSGDDDSPASGAHFDDPFVDPFPDSIFGFLSRGSLSGALPGEAQEGGAGSGELGDIFAAVGAVAPSQQAPGPTFTGSGAPVVSIPGPGGATTQVFEAGLPALRGVGESAGSDAGNPDGKAPTTTQPGLINFTSPDGVQSVSLGGHLLTTSAQTFTDGTTGSLTAFYTFDPTTHQGAIHYTYTLLDNTLSVPTTSFAVVITDPNGDIAGGNLAISIKDDGPIAKQDVDILGAGQATETGNVLTGAGTAGGLNGSSADVPGADGGVTVVGVAAGIGAGGANPATVGVAVAGAFGTLTVNADGTYTYVHGTGGGSDIFTYTIRDADGSLSRTTLTIILGDSAPGNIVVPASDTPGQTQVFEAGLSARTINGTAEPAGSNPASPTTSSGTITFTSPDGISRVELGSLVLTSPGTPQSFTDGTGTLTASFAFNAATGQGTITYTYTLLDNTLIDPSTVSFAVAVTDTDGDRTAGNNLVITIKDDAPTAAAATDSVAAGQLSAETGNVLTGAGTTSGTAAVQGADGAVIAGVAAGDTGADLVNAGTVGAAIAGAFGVLTLNADGSYSYVHNGSPGGGSDIFTYTIRDADGDVAHATLTIAVADSAPGNIVVPAVGSGDATVFEGGLPARGGEPAGSNPAASPTASGMITFSSPDGVASVELGGHVVTATSAQTAQTFADGTRGLLTAWISYDATVGGGAINYTYTLLDNTDARVIPSVSLTVAVVDLDGDRTPGSDLVIGIVDDAPGALPDVDVVGAGQTTAETGNVLDGSGTSGGLNGSGADVQGADGAVVVSVAFGSTVVAVDPATGATITGAFGALTIHADGSYSYQRTGAGGVADIFIYTIQDGDGSQSASALTIGIGDSLPGNIVIPAAGGTSTTVFEAGLAPRGGEPAGSHAGDPAFPTTTQTGTITFTSADGVSQVELGGLVLTATGTPGTFTDTTGTLTASYTFNAATGQGTITYSYTLLDNTVGVPSGNFAVAVTDADGDRIVGGNLVITIADDAPTAVADADSVAAGQTAAETGNVLTGIGTTSGVADVMGADGAAVAGVAAGDTGTDLINAGSVGTAIAGAFGTLTLGADGSYSYVRNAGTPGGGTDIFTYTIRDADGSLSHATLTIAVADSAPGNIVIPPPGVAGQGTLVDEAGLPARGAEPAGSNAASSSETTTGVITFTSPDGISRVELGSLVLTSPGTPQSFTDGTGTLTASFAFNAATGQGTITYTYTLLDNTLIDPSTVSFAVAVTDGNNVRTVAGSNLVIAITDDAPSAHADTVVASQAEMIGSVLANDVRGADDALVASVAFGSNPAVDVDVLGTTISGQFGTLTISLNGAYTYDLLGNPPPGATDTFTYTIRDLDGDQSTATLTLAVSANSVPTAVIPPAGGPDTTVNEAGLPARGSKPAGSDPAASITTSGAIAFSSPDGVTSVSLGGHVLTGTAQTFADGTTGLLTASFAFDTATGQGTINYTYTLTDNTAGDQAVNNGDTSVNFAVVVTDTNGDINPTANLVITIVDDRPIALADTDAIVPGQTTPETGNVITGAGTTSGAVGADIQGGDGASGLIAGTGVVGVATGNTNADLTDGSTVGAAIHGTFGTLTLQENGDYSYARDVGPLPGGVTDTFTYTIKDADGSLAHATLNITLADSAPADIVIPTGGDPGTVVMEGGLPTGSHATDPSFEISVFNTITFTSLDGVFGIELVDINDTNNRIDLNSLFQSGTATDATGSLMASYTFDAAAGSGEIHYRYTLLDNVIGDPTVNNGNTVKIFAVSITDLDLDRARDNLNIIIVDDAPDAKPDDVFVPGFTTAFANVITGEGTTIGVTNADIQGADGAQLVGVELGDTGRNFVDPNFGGFFATPSGLYQFTNNGFFGFDRDIVAPDGASETLTYTIQDADGSLSHATLTIHLGVAGNATANIAPATDDQIGGTLTGGSGANHFTFNSLSQSGDHILDFKPGTDSIDVLLAGFAGLSGTGAVAGTDFVTSTDAAMADLGAAHFAYNQSNGQLFYDSNGGDASGASRILLAVLDNHAALAATDIHKV